MFSDYYYYRAVVNKNNTAEIKNIKNTIPKIIHKPYVWLREKNTNELIKHIISNANVNIPDNIKILPINLVFIIYSPFHRFSYVLL